ncbi:MAG: 2TM domain-containing protein [Bacteroidia bacterium]|nr:2TM domain-containing protein [Bacteroidia bacterium]
MGRRKNRKKKTLRERIAGFKIHGMIYLGIMTIFSALIIFDSGGRDLESPVVIGLLWGLGLFLHYAVGVLGFKWKEEARLKDQAEEEYHKQEEEAINFSSEYDLSNAPGQKRQEEDWDGVDVRVHDIDN